MHVNAKGLALIKSFEGCELKAYKCPAGIWTIGYGSTGPHVKPGMEITAPEAEALLKRDLSRFETGVNAMVEEATSDQFSAIVSLAFNVGLANVAKSTLLKKHKRADFKGAANEFLRWNRAGGRILAGLTRRRAAERRLYLGEV